MVIVPFSFSVTFVSNKLILCFENSETDLVFLSKEGVRNLKVALMCKANRIPQNLQILSYNVEGLKPKLDNLSFTDFIQKYDISIFTETWKSNNSKINIEGLWDYSQVRPKHKNAIR